MKLSKKSLINRYSFIFETSYIYIYFFLIRKDLYLEYYICKNKINQFFLLDDFFFFFFLNNIFQTQKKIVEKNNI